VSRLGSQRESSPGFILPGTSQPIEGLVVRVREQCGARVSGGEHEGSDGSLFHRGLDDECHPIEPITCIIHVLDGVGIEEVRRGLGGQQAHRDAVSDHFTYCLLELLDVPTLRLVQQVDMNDEDVVVEEADAPGGEFGFLNV